MGIQQQAGLAQIASGFMQGKNQRAQEGKQADMAKLQKQALELGIKIKQQGLSEDEFFMDLMRGGGPSQPTDVPSAAGGAGMTMGQPDLPVAEQIAGQIGIPGISKEQLIAGEMYKRHGVRQSIPRTFPVAGVGPGGEPVNKIMYADGKGGIREIGVEPRYEEPVPVKEVSPETGQETTTYIKPSELASGRVGGPQKFITKVAWSKRMIPDSEARLFRSLKTGEPMGKGFNEETAKKAGFQRFTPASIASIDNLQIKAMPVLKRIFEQVETLYPGLKTGLGARIKQGAKFKYEILTQNDPRYTSFIGSVKMFTALLSRSISGEVGVLTDTDIARIEKALPRWNDSPATAKQRMNDAFAIVQKRIDQEGYDWIKLPRFDLPAFGKPTPAGPGKKESRQDRKNRLLKEAGVD